MLLNPLFLLLLVVHSLPALQARIDRAVLGDVIVVGNGVYTTATAITVTRAGTSDHPIRIRAETTGGVEIAGTHGFVVNSPAAFVEIDGFRFTHAADLDEQIGRAHV